MSTYGKKGEIPADPRVLANQHKILQHLQALREEQQHFKQEQHRLKQDIHLIMKESKHFQKNVYDYFKQMNSEVCYLQECVDDITSLSGSINSRTKSVYKHLKSSRQEVVSSPSDLDSKSRRHRRHTRTAAKPKYNDGLWQENHVDSCTPDSDTDNSQPFKKQSEEDPSKVLSMRESVKFGDFPSKIVTKVDLPTKEDYNSVPYLQSHSSNGKKKKTQNISPHTSQLEPNSTRNGSSNKMPSPHIRSPVEIRDRPPENVPKPHTTRHQQQKQQQRELTESPALPIGGLDKYPIPYPRLYELTASTRDRKKFLQKLGMDVLPDTLTAVKEASQSKGAGRNQIGLHTIIIIDMSASMAGEPFEKMKTFLNGFLEIIDESAERFALEEYISFMTFGQKSKIMQPFTNDYIHLKQSVREDFKRLRVCGKSPLHQCLTSALTYIECHGDGVILHDHVVLPRIIIISDFVVSMEHSQDDDDDIVTSEESIRAQQKVYSLMAVLKKRRYQTFCVPVGDYNSHVCEEIVRLGSGSVIDSANFHEAGYFYRYQIIAANCLNEFNESQDRGIELDIDELIENALVTAGLPVEDKDIVQHFLTTALAGESLDDLEEDEIENDVGAVGGVDMNKHSTSTYQQSISPASSHGSSNKHDSLETTDTMTTTDSIATGDSLGDLPEWRVPKGTINLSLQEIGRLPPLGSRVQRGKDWNWEGQDGRGPGTIVGHKSEGIVFVLWDRTSQIGSCRFGYQGDSYDVEVVKSIRQVSKGNIEIGCLVVRGTNWSKGDEDGGVGTEGVVIRKLPGRLVQVRWPSRVIDTYKFGADDQWEVKVTSDEPVPAEGTRAPSPRPEVVVQVSEERPAIPGEEEPQPIWQWQDRSDQWRIMSPDAISKLENVYSRNPQGNVMINHKGKNAKVYLGGMECEINGSKRPIQRQVMMPSDIQNLQMVENMITD